MLKVIAGFVAGVVVALGGAAAAGTTNENPEGVRTTCHAWNKPRTYQCNVYMPEFHHARIVLYEADEYALGVDYWPGWAPRILAAK